MAGEAEPLAPSSTPVAGEAPAAAAASPAAAPAAAPVVSEAPAAPVAETPAAPASEPTLLEKFDAEQAAKKPEAKPDAKPAEAIQNPVIEPKPVEAKPQEKKPDGSPAEVPAAEPFAYEYTLPETIKLDDKTKGSFHSALDMVRTDPNKGVQALVDLHNQTMQEYADQTYRNQVSTFNDTRRGWVTQTMADDELGGAGHQTSMAAIARMRDLLVPEAKREAFNEFLAVTGAGDHPEFLRLLHNAARIYDEAPMPPPGARPPANIGKPQGRGLRGMYKSNQGRQQ